MTPKSYISWSQYGELIKIKQTVLLLFTAVCTYLISVFQTSFIFMDFFWLVVALFFAIAGSTLLNMYIDRDIDALMERTKHRPLVSMTVRPFTVLIHGIIFTGLGLVISTLFLNYNTLIIIFLGFFFDVVVYTMLLKRRTRFSIIFGGIAGGLPAIAGRVAVTGTIDLLAILFGLFVICWIPLHILSLALIPKNLEGYRQANVPMWPVVSDPASTRRIIAFSALVSALVIIPVSYFLSIHILVFLPQLVFSLYLMYLSSSIIIHPSEVKTFKLFKFASMFMVISFLYLYVGLVLSSFLG
ncbi:MAG: heme o synthase [Promethearchaeota archaeon]